MARKIDSKALLKQVLDGIELQEADAEKLNEEQRLRILLDKHLYLDDSPARLRLRKEYLSGEVITGADGIRRKLGAIDLAFFGRAYLPHYFVRESPDFHAELDRLWVDGVLKGVDPFEKREAASINRMAGSKRATAAPRGHAKSTNLTFKDDLHAVLYEYKKYILILSDTYDQAVSFLVAIKEELEENTAIVEDFGYLAGKIWKEDVLLTSSKIKIQAKGSGQKVRGLKHKNWRPDLIVLDDVENDELVRTPEQRKKLENWFYKALSKAGDTYTDIIFIGTVLHYDSLLSKVMKNPQYRSIKYKAIESFSDSPKWSEWEEIYTDLDNDNRERDALCFFEVNQEEMLEGTKVLWSEKLSYYDLMAIKVSEGDAAFNSELQNEPINPEDCLFNEEWFDYYNPHEVDFSNKEFSFFGFVDPSLGKSKKSDFSAIITVAKSSKSGYMYVVDADVERRHPDQIIEDVLQKAVWIKKEFRKRYIKFGAETNQFQWFLKEQLAKASARAGIYLPIVEVSQSRDKVLRVQTLQPDIKNKYIKFNKQHKRLLEQLKFFPLGDHDDAPDALEGCRSLITSQKNQVRFLSKRIFGL